MSATATTLSPEDNRELLDAAAAALTPAARRQTRRHAGKARHRGRARRRRRAVAVRDDRPLPNPARRAAC